MPFQTQALNELAASITGAVSAASQANALAQNAQQINQPLVVAGDVVEVNTDYTMDGTKSCVIVDTETATADVTVTLPDAALNDGKMFWIKRTGGTHTLVVVPQGSQTIDGLAQVPGGFAPNVSILVVAIGDNWSLLSQSVGTPPNLDTQVIISDAGLDPNVPFCLVDASSNPVTLTLPAVASVEGQQFTVICYDSSNLVTLATASGSEFLLLAGKPKTSVPLLGGTTFVLVAKTFGGIALWVSQGIVSPFLVNAAFTADTTVSNVPESLPSAAQAEGSLRAYKNTGTGGHTYTISRDGADTIDGSASPIVLNDGESVSLVQDPLSVSNWISLIPTARIPTVVQAFAEDTTSADVPVTLPAASTSGNLLVLYKNIGSGGHHVAVSPAGSDTIDGSGTALNVVDEHWAGFVREDGSTTNWVSVVEPVITPPVIPPAAVAFNEDTTSADVLVTLPAASASVGTVVAYYNSFGTHNVVVSPAGSDTIDNNPGSVLIIQANFGAFVAASNTNWVSLVPPQTVVRAASTVTGVDTIETLPSAATAGNSLRCYKNLGTLGHTLTVNPSGLDTIDNVGTGVVVADGKTACLVVEYGGSTNWVLVSLD